MPKTGGAESVRQAGVNSVSSAAVRQPAPAAELPALLVAEVDGNAVTVATKDLALMTALAERMAAIISTATGAPGFTPVQQPEGGSYPRILELEQGLPVVPFECYTEDGGWRCAECSSDHGGAESKHGAQHVSIGRHLDAVGALPIAAATCGGACACGYSQLSVAGVKKCTGSEEPLCLVEFCAGKALLAKQICAMAEGRLRQPVDVVLIDRTEVRHDAFTLTAEDLDLALDATDTEASVVRSHTRLTVDIADLCLERMPQFQKAGRSLAIGKHLCGVATDLTLRCYVNAVASAAALDGGGGGDRAGRPSAGSLALALCCHHLCEWDGYANTQLLMSHGIGPGEFQLMKRLATKYRAHPCRQRSSGKDVKLADTIGAQLAAARASCGIIAKRCLNEGRASWLRGQAGWGNGSVRLVRYVAESDSPENFLLLGVHG